jgi:di/tricarboxylate transporter
MINYLQPELIQFLIIVSIMIISFIFEIVAMEVTALGTIGLLLVFNIITIEEAISGFSNKAVITIGAIFIISKALVKTGFLEVLSDYLFRLGGNNKWLTFSIFFITTSIISGFLNNTAAVAIFIPLAFKLCQKFHISPTKILMPLSYAAIFGGTLTLIGTSTNLIVNSFLEGNSSIQPFKMFEFTKLGMIFFIVGTFYNLFISRWVLPSRAITTSLTQKYHLSTYLTEFKLEQNSQLIGKSITDLKINNKYEFDVVKIIRNKVSLSISLNDVIIRRDDILLVQINVNDIIKFKKDLALLLLSDIKLSQNELTGNNHVLIEGLISQNSSIIGKTLSQLNYRETYNSFVLAIKRQTELLREKVAHVKLKFSDTLLIMVPKDKIEKLRSSNDLIILEELDIHLRYERYWWLSILIIPLIMIFASMQILTITEGAILGSILLLVLRSISMEDVYEAINWPVIFLIALLIPIGIAMENTGTANFLSEGIIYFVNSRELGLLEQVTYVVSILYFITFITSAFISNAAVAIILSPLAIILADYFKSIDPSMAIDPSRAFLMAICFGASASFMTPIGYQTNLMVFAPGQYKFKDFMIAGAPLTVIFWIIASYFIPIFWPFISN